MQREFATLCALKQVKGGWYFVMSRRSTNGDARP
jgi:hypothetical protein